MHPRPVILELPGGRARLEPLTLGHAPGLLEAGRDESIWRWLTVARPADLDAMRAYVRRALDGQRGGGELPFAAVDRQDGRVAGTTRYLDIRRDSRGIEIGWTWYGVAWQRTSVNTECKYLLLRHAFEELGAARVQLKTDARNERSRAAILRIGATFEGVLRKHQMTHSGYIRDTAFHSILDDEWPGVKGRMKGMMGGAAME